MVATLWPRIYVPMRLLCLLIAALAVPVAAQGRFVDLGSGPGGAPINGPVYAVAVGPDGTYYAAGRFSQAGPGPALNVARWTGSAWAPMGDGLSGGADGGTVHALAVARDGTVYAGGSFERSGTTAVRNVARWDGTSWQPLGSGTNRTVFALAVAADGALYVGGDFITVGGFPYPFIARWSDGAWSRVGPNVGGAVEDIAIGPDGDLYITGRSFTLGWGLSGVLRWDGTAWQYVGDELEDYTIQSVFFKRNGTLFAAGRFSNDDGIFFRVARWVRGRWEPIRPTTAAVDFNGSLTNAAAGRDGTLYATGNFTATRAGTPLLRIARWEDDEWEPMDGGIGGMAYALAATPDGGMLVGGEFTVAGPKASGRVALWDGDAWQSLGSSFDGNVTATAVGPDGQLYAAGLFSAAGEHAVRHGVVRRGADGWEPVGSGFQGPAYALAGGDGRPLCAGGVFSRTGGASTSDVLCWDGSAWQPLGALQRGVYALAYGPDGALYAGGTITSAGPTQVYGIARWDGQAWNAVGGGVGGIVYALAVGADGALYVGGTITSAGGTSVGHVARWDGSAWSDLAGGANNLVRALHVEPDGRVLAGGSFTTIGGVPAGRAAQWDGAAWAEIGGGFDGPVHAFVRTPALGLVAGGDFSTAGWAAARNLARLADGAWTAVGEGTDGPVLALAAEPGGDLALGGAFQHAGGVRSAHLARYTLTPTSGEDAPAASALRLAVSPNPTRGAAVAAIAGTEPGATLTVFDALGRRLHAQRLAGDGRLALPADLPPGVYVVRLSSGDAVRTTRLVVVR